MLNNEGDGIQLFDAQGGLVAMDYTSGQYGAVEGGGRSALPLTSYLLTSTLPSVDEDGAGTEGEGEADVELTAEEHGTALVRTSFVVEHHMHVSEVSFY